MNYVDHSDYKNLLNKFAAGTKKQVLSENYIDLRPINSLNEDDTVEEKRKMTKADIAAMAPPEDEIDAKDFAALRASKGKKEEGIHLGQATGPTVQTVEGKHNLKNLSPDERKQLEEYIKSKKTIETEIVKLLEKAKMGSVEEGGNNTGLTMAIESDNEVDTKLDSLAQRFKGQQVEFSTLEQIADALTKQGHEVNARYIQDYLKGKGVEC